jgi:hypothetical protein
MSDLRLITQSRVDIAVRVKCMTAVRGLQQIIDKPAPSDEEAIAIVAQVIADLVLVERYLTDPRTRWSRKP